MSVAIELDGVGFGYRPGQPVLEDVDLRVEEGEFVAVAGPNGGGKTTLLRLGSASSGRRGPRLLFGEPAHQLQPPAALGYLAQRALSGRGRPATVRELVAAGRLPPAGSGAAARRRPGAA